MDNRTHFIVAASQFIVNDDALLIFESFDVLSHEQNAGDAQETTLVQWNEDGVMADFTFSIDNTKNVVIDSLSLSLVASDGTTTFNLDEITVNLAPNLGNPPTIDTDYTRGYILPSGAEFNLVKVEDGGTVSTKTFYDCVIGQKITWQEWIANANVPPVFIDLAQQNSGLNQKADNYSNENAYKIYLMVSATVTGDDSTQGNITQTYSQLSTEINTYDYFESDDGVIVSGTVETFDSTDTYNLNGGFLENEETLFKTTWVGASPLVLANVAYVIHRIERENALGQLEIEESSSLRGAVTGGKLEAMTVVQSGSDIVSTCIIKAGALSGGNWKLSARIETPPIPTVFGWVLAHLTNPNGLAVVFTARAEIYANNKTFTSVNTATVSTDYEFYIGDSGADLNDANAGRWGTFSALTFAQFDATAVPATYKVLIKYTGAVTDPDILTAFKVALNETAIVSATNVIKTASQVAIEDVMLPFQTDTDVDSIATANATNTYSEVRTDAEISAGTDLTDFVAGIGSLVNLDVDATGHFLTSPSTISQAGDITIQTTAATSTEGALSGLATPLQNLYYPLDGLGANPNAWGNDLVNDDLRVSDATFAQYMDYNTVADDDYIIVQATYRPTNTIIYQTVLAATNGTSNTLMYHFSNTNDFRFGIVTSGGTAMVLIAPAFKDIGNVYTVTFCARKAQNIAGGAGTKFDVANSFAVINGRFVPVTGAQSTSAVYNPVPAPTDVVFNSRANGSFNSVGTIYHAAVKVSSSPISLEDCRRYALGEILSMPYSYLFNAYSSPNQFANGGTVVGVPDAIATNHVGTLTNIFL